MHKLVGNIYCKVAHTEVSDESESETEGMNNSLPFPKSLNLPRSSGAGTVPKLQLRTDTIPLNKLLDAHLKKNGLVMPYGKVVKMHKEKDAKNYLSYAQQNSDVYGAGCVRRDED